MKAHFYGRISPRPEQGQGNSLAAQLEKCAAYCVMRGWNLATTNQDEHLSGKTMDRPGLQAALAEVKKGDVLIAYSLSRLARSTTDAIMISGILTDRGAELALVTESIDTSTPTGRLFFSILASLAQFEREITVERTSSAMLCYQRQGRKMSRIAPYGWKIVPRPGQKDGLEPVPEEQADIAAIKALGDAGFSYRQIAARMVADGRQYRGLDRWHHTAVRTILIRARDVI